MIALHLETAWSDIWELVSIEKFLGLLQHVDFVQVFEVNIQVLDNCKQDWKELQREFFEEFELGFHGQSKLVRYDVGRFGG